MALLMAFALVAGAGTALSPCVLPVLPALLSASAIGGRRRPVGIALGLGVTFAVTIVGLASVIDGVGLGPGATRTLAVVVLIAFGVVLAVPGLAARVEAPLARLSRLGPRRAGGGFASGLLVGGALGFVYAPCAGPILAAVIAVGAASSRTVPVGVAFAAGSSLVLLALALGGRALAGRVRGPWLQRALAAVLVVTGVAMASNLDVRFQSAIADHLPAGLVNPTHGLETSHAVASRLDDLRGPARFAVASSHPSPGMAPKLPVLGTAPELTGTQRWFNSPPLTLKALRGHVVLIDFWTYTCINCLRTLPYLEAWDKRYRDEGLTIVGVHSPEFPFEKDAGNVASAIRREGIRYPVVQDNDLATWGAWGNEYWPAEYLVDAQGRVRNAHFGEGDYEGSEAAIRALLREADHRDPGARATPEGVVTPTDRTTPETYLGLDRDQRFDTPLTAGARTYAAPKDLPLSHFALDGRWRLDDVSATAVRDAEIHATVQARNVYLVLSPPPSGVGTVRVGGGPVVRVDRQRLYQLVRGTRNAWQDLRLEVSPGVSAYAFTFG